jgi:hypothetical protein
MIHKENAKLLFLTNPSFNADAISQRRNCSRQSRSQSFNIRATELIIGYPIPFSLSSCIANQYFHQSRHLQYFSFFQYLGTAETFLAVLTTVGVSR